MNEIRRNVPVDEQIEILKRGVVDLVTEDDLRRKLEQSLKTGKPLRVKLGADPTRPDLHLGHAVILRKMRQFQDLGHQVIMLIGDFTAMIGDPSGKSKTRPPLTLEETRANAHSYLEQCRLILRGEPEVLEIRYNGEWLEPMGYADVIRLASKYTVARILERDDFTKRMKAETPISLHELLYPVTQGYDSVELKADVELGGTDQLFNNLVGRALQRDYGQEAQVVMTLPLLVGLDGTEKMSKSLDNYIGLTDEPHLMFAKLMKVPDTLLDNYFTLLTDLDVDAIENLLNGPPNLSHQVLASLVTSYLYKGIKPNLENLTKSAPGLYYTAFKNSIDEEIRYQDILRVLSGTLLDLKLMSSKIKSIISVSENFGISIESNQLLKIENSIEELDSGIKQGSEALSIIENYKNTSLENFPYNSAMQLLLNFQDLVINTGMADKTKHFLDELTEFLVNAMEINIKRLDYIDTTTVINESLSRYQKVAKGGIPDNIPEINVTADLNDSIDADRISMAKLIVLAGLEPSNGAARKLIQNRGLKLNGETYTDPQGQLTRQELAAEGGAVIQKGKDKFARLVLES